MNQCLQTIADYGLRSIGIGERLLPRTDFTLCQQFTLIGSGLIWNLYFVALSLTFGFVLANGLALSKASRNPWLRCPANGFIFVFRGSPLFIQFFLAYSALVLLPRDGVQLFGLSLSTGWLTRAWAGALIVLTLNTAAYGGEIIRGGLASVQREQMEAARAAGMGRWLLLRRVVLPLV